jgi:hypothetical protein
VSKDSLVVDIGSNDGTLLRGFQRQGMRVLGVEPTNIARIAVAEGIDTVQGFFTERLGREIAGQYGTAKIVTATNVFAHMAELGSFIRGVEHLLADDGVFVIENHYLLSIVEQLQYDTTYHEHLRSYSLKPLIQLFDYYDLTVVDASLTALLREEKQAGLYDSETYVNFRRQVLRTKRDLYRLALEAESKGQRFVGNSCPGRSATLLNYVGIDADLMPYIAEQPTSLKLGKYLPGKHVPVVRNDILFEEQPDWVVLLAWHYWQPISADLRRRGLRSKMVVPLPELQVITE